MRPFKIRLTFDDLMLIGTGVFLGVLVLIIAITCFVVAGDVLFHASKSMISGKR